MKSNEEYQKIVESVQKLDVEDRNGLMSDLFDAIETDRINVSVQNKIERNLNSLDQAIATSVIANIERAIKSFRSAMRRIRAQELRWSKLENIPINPELLTSNIIKQIQDQTSQDLRSIDTMSDNKIEVIVDGKKRIETIKSFFQRIYRNLFPDKSVGASREFIALMSEGLLYDEALSKIKTINTKRANVIPIGSIVLTKEIILLIEQALGKDIEKVSTSDRIRFSITVNEIEYNDVPSNLFGRICIVLLQDITRKPGIARDLLSLIKQGYSQDEAIEKVSTKNLKKMNYPNCL
jgi:hypothetical protein